MHLNDTTYRPLLRSTLPPPAARALAVHLSGECDACETWLASRPSADLLDGLVDTSLVALAPVRAGVDAGAGTGHDLEFARIMARVRAPAHQAPAAGRARPATSRAHRVGPPLALAATVMLASLAGLLWSKGGSQPQPWTGEKGAAVEPVPLKLRFLVLTPEPGGAPGRRRRRCRPRRCGSG